jgi:hypothetical protein
MDIGRSVILVENEISRTFMKLRHKPINQYGKMFPIIIFSAKDGLYTFCCEMAKKRTLTFWGSHSCLMNYEDFLEPRHKYCGS